MTTYPPRPLPIRADGRVTPGKDPNGGRGSRFRSGQPADRNPIPNRSAAVTSRLAGHFPFSFSPYTMYRGKMGKWKMIRRTQQVETIFDFPFFASHPLPPPPDFTPRPRHAPQTAARPADQGERADGQPIEDERKRPSLAPIRATAPAQGPTPAKRTSTPPRPADGTYKNRRNLSGAPINAGYMPVIRCPVFADAL